MSRQERTQLRSLMLLVTLACGCASSGDAPIGERGPELPDSSIRDRGPVPPRVTVPEDSTLADTHSTVAADPKIRLDGSGSEAKSVVIHSPSFGTMGAPFVREFIEPSPRFPQGSMLMHEPPEGWENALPELLRRHNEYRRRYGDPVKSVVSREGRYGDPVKPVVSREEVYLGRDAPHYTPNGEPRLLTAGMFDDTRNPGVFQKFAATVTPRDGLQKIAPYFTVAPTIFRVTDRAGHGVHGAELRIGQRWLYTGTDGRAVYLSGWDTAEDDGSVSVRYGNHQIEQPFHTGGETTITLATVAARPHDLDIALVLDTTGSMADELEYLKVELREISQALKQTFPEARQRFAFVAYRDHGDEYLTRRFDFTDSLDLFIRALGAQSAEGGGDMPEAVHRALAQANKLSWSTGPGTARVAFLVGDAPPHGPDIAAAMDEVDSLRARDVAVYSVAASGVDPSLEFLARAAAVLTGAEYIFLTDDSGVGNPHAEPHIPCYSVEKLATAMHRAIRSELTGRDIELDKDNVIREVGQATHGVCQTPPATQPTPEIVEPGHVEEQVEPLR